MFQSPRGSIILAVLAFLGFVALQSSVPFLDYQLNADSIYLLMITKDIVFDAGHLADWSTSAHLYLYPDVPLVVTILLAHKLGISVFSGCIAIYGLLLAGLVAFAWKKTTAAPFFQSILVGSILLGAVFGGDYLLYKWGPQQSHAPGTSVALDHISALGHILGPALHGGSFIIASAMFFPLYGVLTSMRLSVARVTLLMGWLSCNVVLVTLSDLIFVAWGLIPLSIVVFSGITRNPPRTSLLLISLLWTSAALGYLLSWLIGDEFRSAYFAGSRHSLAQAIQGLLDIARLAGSMTQPVITLFLSVNIFLWCAAAYCLVRELASSVSSVGRGLTVFAGSMSATSVLAPVAAGLFTGDQVRYFIPYLVLGPLFCVFLLMLAALRVLPSAPWSACLAVAALAIIASGGVAWCTLPGPTALRLYRCLQIEGLKFGRASYWDTAPVVAASGWRVKITPLAPGSLDVFPWLTKRQWLQPNPDIHPSEENFIILDEGSAKQALAQYGLPDRTLSCAGRRILVYKHPTWATDNIDRDDTMRR